ncbi:MAG: hypothetical protein ACR2N2_04375 [Acidimicrobiia bacterium]
MDTATEWNWVLLAYGFTYTVLVAYVASIAIRITRAKSVLEEDA